MDMDDDWKKLQERIRIDVSRRDQYAPIDPQEGYICAVDGNAAEFRRPPRPDLMAKFAVYLCRECWTRLP